MRNKKGAISTSMMAAVIVVMVVIGLAVGYVVSTFLAPPPGAATVTSTERSTTTVVETTTVTAATETPEEKWEPDGMIEENEYDHRLELADGRLVVYWRNDDLHLYMALEGRTSGWLSIGFEPTTRMKDADMIFGWVEDGKATVLDLFSQGPTGPHPPDTELDGTDDILEYGGKEENGYTIIEFKRKLDTQDVYDKAFGRGQTISIIWSLADVDDFAAQHNIARGAGELTLD